MKKNNKTGFPLSSAIERKGLLLLILLTATVVIGIGVVKTTFRQNEVDLVQVDSLWSIYKDSFKETLASEKPVTHHDWHTEKPVQTPEAKLFLFDPNMSSEEEFMRLGLPARTAKTIINYRNKGGKFYRVEDFKKIYSLSESQYQQLKPYIRIAEKRKQYSSFEKEKPIKETTFEIIELNSADIQLLKKLSGIGPVLAKRIVKFRSHLGGFYTIDQLKEVYGLPDSTFQKIVKKVKVNAALIEQIDINHADYSTLIKHSYLNKALVTSILKYRTENGNFMQPEDLLNLPLINDENFRKIAPYIKIVK